MMRGTRRDFCAGLVAASAAPAVANAREVAGQRDFVGVSAADKRYFETASNKPWIPIGLSIAFPRTARGLEAVALTDARFRKLSEAGGNTARVWMSHEAFECETTPGVFDETRLWVLDGVVASARRWGIRLKLCLNHFRSFETTPARFPGAVQTGRPEFGRATGGPFNSVLDYFTSSAGREAYRRRLEFFAKHYAQDSTIFGWELWNEIDAVAGQQNIDQSVLLEWSRDMLTEARRLFPNHLVVAARNSERLDARYKACFDAY